MDIQLNKMCRVCLKEGENFKPIFYKNELSSQVSVSNKIMACSSIQVVAGDGLPELICLDCLTQVDIAYEFREKCQNADATLRKYVSMVKPIYSYAQTPTQVILKAGESHLVPKESEGNLEAVSCNINSKQENIKSDDFSNVMKLAEDNSSEVPSTVLKKKKKTDKPNEPKIKKSKDKKKGPNEENGSDCDKKKRTKDEKDVKCPICKKTFAYLCFLKEHMVQHTGAKPYLCSACGKKFGHTASLTNHMKTHYADKPYKCDRCELSFHRRGHLILHIRTHTGEKPYICDVCGRDFAQSTYLKEHKRVHSGEKPFVCDICGHGFARKSCLVMHRRVHTGELPYACPECGRAFSQRSQRKRHVKKNHKESACLRATGELILKDLDLKNKNTNQGEETVNESPVNENSIHDNRLNLSQDSGLMQRDNSTMQQYQLASPNTNSNMLVYQQDNMSMLYPTMVMPLPLIQVQTTLLQ